MVFSLWTWACDQKPTTGQWITLKKQVTTINGTLEPAIQSGDTGQRIPFFDEDIHYQVKHRLHMPWTPSYNYVVMPGHYKKTAKQSTHTVVAI